MGNIEKEEKTMILQEYLNTMLDLTLLFKIEEFEILSSNIIWATTQSDVCSHAGKGFSLQEVKNVSHKFKKHFIMIDSILIKERMLIKSRLSYKA
jgi:hypothetical protein